jgi:hypothetical protein
MQASYNVKFPWAVPDNASVTVVGALPLVLHGTYDPRQLWLPICNFLIINLASPPKRSRPSDVTMKKKSERKFAVVPDKCRALVIPEQGVPQLPLPFPGWRRVSKAYWERLVDADFPGWQLDHGNPLGFEFDRDHHDQIVEFLDLNATGRYHIRSKSVFFELDTDYVLTKVGFWVRDGRW